MRTSALLRRAGASVARRGVAALATRAASSMQGAMKVFDTRSQRHVRVAGPGERDGGALVWYACGPTVYDAAHLGHARTYVSLDLLRRATEAFHGIPVRLFMGVTDVDDKIIERAGPGRSESLAREQEHAFFETMARLNVQAPTTLLRVTEHIQSVVSCVMELEAAGFAYSVDSEAGGSGNSGVYFSVSSFEAAGGIYGHLAPSQVTSREGGPGGRVPGWKRDARDFALWKLAKPGEPSWESPWGAGRPGWHIECSAMTLAAAGSRLDLHAGGSDLCFPHHVNEMAQSEAILSARAASGNIESPDEATWVKVWCHPGPLLIQGRKMAKSLKNFITVNDLLDAQGLGSPEQAPLRHVALADPADAFRLFCLRHPYRSAVTFTSDSLTSAGAQMARWSRFVRDAEAAAAVAWAKSLPGDGASSACKPSTLRWGEREVALARAAEELRAKVAAALADDLDGPAAVRELAAAVDLGLGALTATEGNANPFPLFSVAHEVARTLKDLGFASVALPRSPFAPAVSLSDAGPSKSSASADVAERILSTFRDAVRTATLEGDSSEASARVLAVCDALRDEVCPDLLPHMDVRDKVVGDESEPLRAIFARAAGRVGAEPASPVRGGRALSSKRATTTADVLHPRQMFLNDSRFSHWDDFGVPTADSDGSPLSRSQRNKLRSQQTKQLKRWAKARNLTAQAQAELAVSIGMSAKPKPPRH